MANRQSWVATNDVESLGVIVGAIHQGRCVAWVGADLEALLCADGIDSASESNCGPVVGGVGCGARDLELLRAGELWLLLANLEKRYASIVTYTS